MDRTKYPWSHHLLELRTRLLRVLIVFALGTGFGWYFAPHLFSVLVLPFATSTNATQLVYTHVTEAFVTYMRVGLSTGLLLATPYAINQLWYFLEPGLKVSEARALKPVFWVTPLLFVTGMTFAYTLVLPNAFAFFAGFQDSLALGANTLTLDLMARMESYLDITLQILFAFGCAFQVPVLMYVLAVLGVCTPDHYRKFRRVAIIAIMIMSAVLTPPDVMSMLVLAIPVYALYEGTIIIIAHITKRKKNDA